jgi:hypothetical protein
MKADLAKLQERGSLLECAMIRETKGEDGLKAALGNMSAADFDAIKPKIPAFKNAYERWYSECLPVIRALLPDRIDSFVRQYEKPKNRKDISYESYVIEDYMINLRVTYGMETKVDTSAAIHKLQNQTAILSACAARFESSLFEIKQLVQADLFDSEIESSKHLLRNKFLRAAGAIAGVVLEKHLLQVCADHNVKIPKKNPGISDLNQLLRDAEVIALPDWRHISLLGDYRNLCDHKKAADPTEAQVKDLIDGVEKIIKAVA